MEREIIGMPECPLLYRWTLLDVGFAKLLLHRFLPTQRDRDPHDHPRSFVTFVFRGDYEDVQPCYGCDADGRGGDYLGSLCDECGGSGIGEVDRVRAPAIRFRRAEHAHITVAGPKGAWSIVVMGPRRRRWGFLRDGRWWPWHDYENRFGSAFRCEKTDR